MANRVRKAVRAILLSPDQELLLIRLVLPDRSFWITLGGGIEGDEHPRRALERELHEETGRTDWCIGPEVWTRDHTFDFAGQTMRQIERFFVVYSKRFTPPAVMPDEVERTIVGQYRWWTLERIRQSSDEFAPRRLAELLPSILAGNMPNRPIEVGA